MGDDGDIAEKLGFLLHGDDDEEIVHVAAVMFVTEVHGDEAVELVEVNVRDELAGEITDHDAVAGAPVEEAFAGR